MSKVLKSRNIIFFLISTFIMIGLFSGCSNVAADGKKENSPDLKKYNYSTITPEEAKKRLDSEEDIILLDVRTKEEYDSGHIKNSILIPLDQLETEVEKQLTDKDATIFVYCRSGNRSTSASQILSQLGYNNVYNLGGIIDWPYEIIN